MNSQLIINLDAIRSNIEQIRSHLNPNTRIMAVLKGGTYGIGRAAPLAKFLSDLGVDIFGLAFVDEAVSLRQAGIKEDLFVLLPHPEEIEKIVKCGLQIAIDDLDTLREFEGLKEIKVHLHINTGMNRLGCPLQNAIKLAERIAISPSLKLEGIMSHFPSAEDPLHDTFTLHQLHEMSAVIAALKESGIEYNWAHIGNSAGALRFRRPEFNMVRIGLIMYGIHPSRETGRTLALKPALTLSSRITQVKTLNKGDTVSYGRTYEAKGDGEVVAVVPIGYHDGIHRCFSNRASVLVRGKRAKIIGMICMDFMMIDVTHINGAQKGDTVTIFGVDEYGNEQRAEDFAAEGGTIAHELITCLGPRIKRIFASGRFGNLPLNIQERNVGLALEDIPFK